MNNKLDQAEEEIYILSTCRLKLYNQRKTKQKELKEAESPCEL